MQADDVPRQQRPTLSHSKRSGRFAFSEVRRLHLEFLKRNWAWLLLIDALAVVPSAPFLLLEHSSFLRGAVIGSLLTAVLAFDVVTAMLYTGTAPRIMGGTAEQWTSDVLRGMQKHGYILINHTGLHAGDMDHVLIGPGGAHVVETKWSASPWDVSQENPWLAAASKQLRRSAKALELFLKPHGVTTVEPVLVLWGKAGARLRDLPSPVQRASDGVVVMPGEALERWMLGRPRGVLTDVQAREAAAKLTQQTLRRDAKESLTPTAGSLALGLARVVGLTMLGLFLPAYALQAVPRDISAALLILAVIGCLLLRRSPTWRVAATGASTALVFWMLIVGLDFALRH